MTEDEFKFPATYGSAFAARMRTLPEFKALDMPQSVFEAIVISAHVAGKNAGRNEYFRDVCMACGCTEEHACVEDDGKPCGWADKDHLLCTACAPFYAAGDPDAERA